MTPSQYHLLNEAERNAFDAICDLRDGDTLLHMIADLIRTENSSDKVKHYLQEFARQGMDSPKVYIDTLGRPVWNALWAVLDANGKVHN